MRFGISSLFLASLAGGVYYLTSLASQWQTPSGSLPKASPEHQVIQLANTRLLHKVRVTRCDTDGFVVSCSEGTFKIWNTMLTPEGFAKLQQGAPDATPTPTFHSLFEEKEKEKKKEQSPKDAKDSALRALKDLL
jgi:hypothetical protein